MKFGLYGGSFDPVHMGHLIAAQDALECCDLDRVIFIPAAQAPLKRQPIQAMGIDRLLMLEAAIETDSRFVVSDFEVRRGGVSYTRDTVAHFKAEYPSDSLFWIIGGDQLANLPQWRAIEEIALQVEFIVVARPGEAVCALPPIAGLRVHRCAGHGIGLSSTELRERVSRGLPLNYLMPHKALVLLKERGLYRRHLSYEK